MSNFINKYVLWASCIIVFFIAAECADSPATQGNNPDGGGTSGGTGTSGGGGTSGGTGTSGGGGTSGGTGTSGGGGTSGGTGTSGGGGTSGGTGTSGGGGTPGNVGPPADIGKRAFHAAVEFKNELYVIGGYAGVDDSTKNHVFRSDVLKSADGKDWQTVLTEDKSPFAKRAFHAVAVLGDAMYLVGGYDGTDALNDVWKTTDGTTWTVVTTTGSFKKRMGHTLSVIDDTLYMVGGYDNNYVYYGPGYGTWFTTDGTAWSQIGHDSDQVKYFNPDDGATVGRYLHTAVVHNNKVYMLAGIAGGGWEDDLWELTFGDATTKSKDKEEWKQVEFAFDDSKVADGGHKKDNRQGHASVVINGKMYMIGGKNADNEATNDVQQLEKITTERGSRESGGSYTKAKYDKGTSGTEFGWDLKEIKPTNNEGFPKRYGHRAVVFNNKIYVLGGMDTDKNIYVLGGFDSPKENAPTAVYDDVWVSADKGATWTQQPQK